MQPSGLLRYNENASGIPENEEIKPHARSGNDYLSCLCWQG